VASSAIIGLGVGNPIPELISFSSKYDYVYMDIGSKQIHI
jgi:hypothetical protein